MKSATPGCSRRQVVRQNKAYARNSDCLAGLLGRPEVLLRPKCLGPNCRFERHDTPKLSAWMLYNLTSAILHLEYRIRSRRHRCSICVTSPVLFLNRQSLLNCLPPNASIWYLCSEPQHSMELFQAYSSRKMWLYRCARGIFHAFILGSHSYGIFSISFFPSSQNTPRSA